MKLTGAQVAKLAYDVGFRNTRKREFLTIMVAIAAGESGWRTEAHALSRIEDSRGLWQINVWAHPVYQRFNMYNPRINASAARAVYLNAGSSFRPWTIYLNGSYLQYMKAARAGVRAIGQAGPIPEGGEAEPTPGEITGWDGHLRQATSRTLGMAGYLTWSANRLKRMKGM